MLIRDCCLFCSFLTTSIVGIFWCRNRMPQHHHEPNLDPSLVPKVEFHHLVKRYNRRSDAEPALNDFNLTLYQDQITSLIGHNGAFRNGLVALFLSFRVVSSLFRLFRLVFFFRRRSRKIDLRGVANGDARTHVWRLHHRRQIDCTRNACGPSLRRFLPSGQYSVRSTDCARSHLHLHANQRKICFG